ncbi:Carboxypeptidase regulatory-like domain-containing protein [Sulfidibacter corallicola]|uniref:Carboxypeptidase regulatory-like domain-containing protein n=1 Tax=Sulfidibacter corallicola TaxID=2818388 RepID=A0A8A4TN22_SULCO|nr:carboxypeptidase-like regulatory domain-containing protein [Sulfidibacter corallicola]QTD50291.1 carboxypeptidase regulatory-like domain-containing protein [Sulfidibacter corallicola]
MEILRNRTPHGMAIRALAIAALSTLLAIHTWAQSPKDDHVVALPGLSATVLYDVPSSEPLGLGIPTDMALDPLSGDLFIGQFERNILRLNPDTLQVEAIDFGTEALGFAADGTMYFGVQNFILGAWFREADIFRKFAVIPSVKGVEFAPDGRMFVAEGNFGPSGLFPDTVLEVDRGDGFFRPVWDTIAAEAQLGVGLDAMAALGIDDAGILYVTYHTGELIKQRADGSYISLNLRAGRIGGLNEGRIDFADGLMYQFDSSTGQVFAIGEDEVARLLLYSDALIGVRSSANAVTTDGRNLYVAGDFETLWRVTATDGSPLSDVITIDRGAGTVTGTITILFSDQPLADAEIRFQNGVSTVTDADGNFQVDLGAGLYEASVSKQDFISRFLNLEVLPGETTRIDLALNPGLPESLAPGLGAEVLARKSTDQFSGSSDIFMDHQGNLYSMNFASGNITKHILDPETRAHVRSYVFATGGNLFNSFIVTVDADLNVYASTGNDGVMCLPPRDTEETYILTSDPQDPTIVRDENGVNRVISLVRDVDGIAILSNGDLIFSSGSGGAPIPGLPEGTTNSLVRHRNGVETIYSRGIPAAGGQSLFQNNDILKPDAQDRLMLGMRTGDVARVDTNGVAELIWPGDGTGKPDGLGAFTGLNADVDGNLFVRGDTGDGSTSVFRMISPDGENLLTVASGMSQCFGGFAFDRGGRDVIISENELIIRIFTLDGRTIAQNLLDPPGPSVTKRGPRIRLLATPHRINPHPEL